MVGQNAADVSMLIVIGMKYDEAPVEEDKAEEQ